MGRFFYSSMLQLTHSHNSLAKGFGKVPYGCDLEQLCDPPTAKLLKSFSCKRLCAQTGHACGCPAGDTTNHRTTIWYHSFLFPVLARPTSPVSGPGLKGLQRKDPDLACAARDTKDIFFIKFSLDSHPKSFSYILMHVFILLLRPNQISRTFYVQVLA